MYLMCLALNFVHFIMNVLTQSVIKIKIWRMHVEIFFVPSTLLYTSYARKITAKKKQFLFRLPRIEFA